jgi:hypothetical protein|tara:strand:- start:1885 stop:2112 length:228 start_codon:yes stop_codon:yes gene_type:complete
MSNKKSKLKTIAGLFFRQKGNVDYMKGQVFVEEDVHLKKGDTILLYPSMSKSKQESNKWYLKIEADTEEATDSSE